MLIGRLLPVVFSQSHASCKKDFKLWHKKIGLTRIEAVTCIYVNPKLAQFWLIDYRIYDLKGDGKTELDHVREMLSPTVYHKQLSFRAVLMDTWYATKGLMLFIEGLEKFYYGLLKDNRQVDDSEGQQAYRCVDALTWSLLEQAQGKPIQIKGFPKDHKVQCFRVEVSPHRTDFVVHQRFDSGFDAGNTTGVGLSLED